MLRRTVGHRAAAIADRNSLAGVVRAHVAAEECGIGLAVGARLSFDLEEGGAPEVLALPRDRAGYGRLSRLLTRGKRLGEEELLAFVNGLEVSQVTKDRLLLLKPQTYVGLAESLLKHL